MTKICINACYGGMSLSPAACAWLRAERGYAPWKPDVSDTLPIDPLEYAFTSSRHHPDLIAVIEALGPKAAGGPHAELELVEVHGRYRIVEYDGLEWIEAPESIEWLDADAEPTPPALD
jgi:hypothetical protein